MTAIVSADVKGEPGTGFEKAGDKGPFECGNCSYMKQGACTQPVMIKESKQPRDAQGNVKVDEHDCCEYVERVGKAAAQVKQKFGLMASKRRMR